MSFDASIIKEISFLYSVIIFEMSNNMNNTNIFLKRKYFDINAI